MDRLVVGRVVHYVAYGTPGGEYQAGAHRAAIVTQLLDAKDSVEAAENWVVLAVFNPTGIHWNKAPYDDKEKKPGTWHWIERA